MKRIVVTGAEGLIGWHAWARLHAENCAATFNNAPVPYDVVNLNHREFENPDILRSAVKGADAVLHFAGVNRGSDDEVEGANPAIARSLLAACKAEGVEPHIVYANSIHATTESPYGRSKRLAGEILGAAFPLCTNLILPHIFGECARPFYNNVTATFIHQILAGQDISVNPDGSVQLLHAGAAAQAAINAVLDRMTGDHSPTPLPMKIPDLLEKLQGYHDKYSANIYPDLGDDFELQLFNSYRAATYPDSWPRTLKLHTDARGMLFEAVKGGGGGQTFLSTTKPGITRGDHFHLNKVERFLVIQGEAIIRIRRIGADRVWEYRVTGNAPAPVDMPTLHTHSIENIGNTPLLTLFWTHDLFDPKNTDTFADKVLK